MSSNQFSNHPREVDLVDGVQPVDPLAQFPSEDAAGQPVKRNQSDAVASSSRTFERHTHALNTERDAGPPLAFASEKTFTSEKTLKEAVSRSPDPADRVASSELFSAIRVKLVLAWSFVVRAAQHYTPRVKTFLAAASRKAWHLSARALHAVVLTLYARSRAVSSSLRQGIGRVREHEAFGVADVMRIANAERVSLWRALCFRATATVNQLRGQLRVAPGPASLLAPSSSTRRMLQAHQWTYAVGLFVSGAAVGASLMSFERPPSDRSVPAGSIPVGAPLVSTKQTAAPRSSVGDLTAIRPSAVVLADAPPRLDRPVPTNGSRSPARQRAQRVRQEPREIAAPLRREAFRGSLQINSRPDGAAVFINGRQVGTTPLVLGDLPAGSRVVRLTLAGYEPWSRAVQVVAYQRTGLVATLQASRTE